MLPRTNIEEKLHILRNQTAQEEIILDEVYELLRQDQESEDRITANISGNMLIPENDFDFDLLETKNIFHIDQIKNICINYRLRFLDTKYFKGQIPAEAISKIKRLEKEHNTEIKGYKIIAPSKLFKLEDKDDPLLFAPIGNGYYYLVHKWGNDLNSLRRILVWPFKNIINLSVLVVLMSYLATLLVPEGLFSKSSSTAEFWIIFFFMFKSIAAVVIFYGFALGKNFNPAIWNSKYFNA